DIGLAGVAVLDAVAQSLLDEQTRSATEYNEVEQRVAAETVGAVHRYAGDFAAGIQARNDDVVAVGIDGQRLAVNVGRNTAHHVMAGRYNRYRLDDRIGVREGFRQLADTGQARVQHFLAEVLKLEVDVVAVGTAAAAFDDFANHRTRDNVATGKVLGVRRVAFHETLAILIDEVTAFTAAAFGDEYTSAGDTCRVELPHFN